MEGETPNLGALRAKAQHTLAQSVLIELELGNTFLDAAEAIEDHSYAQENRERAINTLLTADKFLSEIQPGAMNIAAILQRRKQLALRLSTIPDIDWSGGK